MCEAPIMIIAPSVWGQRAPPVSRPSPSASSDSDGFSSALICSDFCCRASIFLGLHQICVSSRMPSSDSATQDGRRKTDVRPRGYGTHWGYVHLDDLASASAAACADVRSDSMNFQAPATVLPHGTMAPQLFNSKGQDSSIESEYCITNQDAKLKSCPASRTHREGRSRPLSPVSRSPFGVRRTAHERTATAAHIERTLSSSRTWRSRPLLARRTRVPDRSRGRRQRSICNIPIRPVPRSTVHGPRATRYGPSRHRHRRRILEPHANDAILRTPEGPGRRTRGPDRRRISSVCPVLPRETGARPTGRGTLNRNRRTGPGGWGHWSVVHPHARTRDAYGGSSAVRCHSQQGF